MLGSGSLCTLNDLFSENIESEFMGQLNDAQQFGLMRQIGVELEFSNACVLMGDNISRRWSSNGTIHCPIVCEQRHCPETRV